MIELRKTGEAYKISLIKNQPKHDKKVHVRMNWKTAVDLDLHAFAITSNNEFAHVYFGKKKSTCGNIILDQDAGVGNTSGDNEENLLVVDLSQIKKIIFVANIFRFWGNIFSSGDKFDNYDGQIYIRTLDQEIKFFLNSKELGRWAVIALIVNKNGEYDFKNINTILKNEPNSDYLTKLT